MRRVRKRCYIQDFIANKCANAYVYVCARTYMCTHSITFIQFIYIKRKLCNNKLFFSIFSRTTTTKTVIASSAIIITTEMFFFVVHLHFHLFTFRCHIKVTIEFQTREIARVDFAMSKMLWLLFFFHLLCRWNIVSLRLFWKIKRDLYMDLFIIFLWMN